MEDKDKSSEELLNAIKNIAKDLGKLNQQAYQTYQLNVDAIILSKTTDNSPIENLLDDMLGFCGDEHVLELYKKLCRYYWEINPQATANYVHYYREMWDSESKDDKL